MRKDQILKHYSGLLCPYAYNTCEAGQVSHCTYLDMVDWLIWKKQAELRASNCKYLGAKLNQKEYETREISIHKKVNFE